MKHRRSFIKKSAVLAGSLALALAFEGAQAADAGTIKVGVLHSL